MKIIKKISMTLVFAIMLMLNLTSVGAIIDSEEISDSIDFLDAINGIATVGVSEPDENEKVYFQSILLTKEEYDSYVKSKDVIEESYKILDEYYDAYKDLQYSKTATVEEITDAYNKYKEYKEKTYDVKVSEFYKSLKQPKDEDWKELQKNATQISETNIYYDFNISHNYQLVWVRAKIDSKEVYNYAIYTIDKIDDESTTDETKEEEKNESEKEDTKDEEKDELEKDDTEDKKKEEVKNPNTGVNDMTLVFITVASILILGYTVVRKKSHFNKNYR